MMMLRLFHFILICTLIIAANPCAAEAAGIVPYDRTRSIEPASTTDDIGIYFLRLAGKKPDFQMLATKSMQSRQITADAASDFMKNEAFRLESKYSNFDPKKDYLVLRVAVDVKFVRLPDGTSTMDIKFPTEGIVYFPFYYDDYPIAMLINGIEAFENMVLTPEETVIATSYLGALGRSTLLMEVVPIKADIKNPVKLDGSLQYPLLCNIDYIGLLNDRAQQIWAWETKQSAKRAHKSQTMSVLGVGAPLGQ